MQRVSKTIANDEQRYLWQQGLLDAEIEVNDNQETLTRRYIYVGLRPIAMIDYDTDNNASIYTIHTDHLGTPQQVSNNKQEIIWQGGYDAFGQVTVKSTPQNNTQDMQAKRKSWLPTLVNSANAAESTTHEAFEFNLRFAGQYEDSESGYYYNWHRYYNPETGRYLTSDPIGLNGGLNTYGYAGQNPVSFVDPWGLYTIFIGGAGDHESFWYIFPNHKVVQYYATNYFHSKLANHFQSKLKVNESRAQQLATFSVKYYGYNQIDRAYDNAIRFLKLFPTANVNIVGHSLGGWQAAHLAQRLNEFKCNSVANLITLDPVSTIYSWNPAGSIKFKGPKTTGPNWINIRAESSSFYPGWNNIVANSGGQWNPSSSGLNPTYNYQIEADHIAIRKMMNHKIILNGKEQNNSPYDLLMQYYNNQSNLNLINTFQ